MLTTYKYIQMHAYMAVYSYIYIYIQHLDA